MSVNEKMTAIADNIRSKTGGTEALTLDDMASGVNDVYDAGLEWLENALVHYRTERKTGYTHSLFYGVNLTGYTFKKTFKPRGTNVRTFYDYTGEELPKNMDFSGITSIYDSSTDTQQFFTWATRLLKIPDYGLPAMEMGISFGYLRACVTIEKIRIAEGMRCPTFTECNSLENLAFEGVISTDLNVSPCKKLSHDSLMNIIECLKDYSEDTSGTVYTLTMGSTNIAKLTEEELLIIKNKGWDYK